jgi:hypothetical protein
MYEADVLYKYLGPLFQNMMINMNFKYRETLDILFIFWYFQLPFPVLSFKK